MTTSFYTPDTGGLKKQNFDNSDSGHTAPKERSDQGLIFIKTEISTYFTNEKVQ